MSVFGFIWYVVMLYSTVMMVEAILHFKLFVYCTDKIMSWLYKDYVSEEKDLYVRFPKLWESIIAFIFVSIFSIFLFAECGVLGMTLQKNINKTEIIEHYKGTGQIVEVDSTYTNVSVDTFIYNKFIKEK